MPRKVFIYKKCFDKLELNVINKKSTEKLIDQVFDVVVELLFLQFD